MPLCKNNQPLSNFHRNVHARDGKSHYCKFCVNKTPAKKLWYANRKLKNQERLRHIKELQRTKEQWHKEKLDRLFANTKMLTYIFSNIQISTEHFYRGEPCWWWQGKLNADGYGSIMQKGIHYGIYRFIYQLFVEIIPPELHCDHLCRNPPCCNPLHIEPVTPGENMLRGISVQAKNAQKIHCKRGHPLSGSNLLVRKDGRECRECKRMHARNYSRNQNTKKGVVTLPPSAERTHCPHGHEYTPENTQINRRGARECRQCRKNRHKRRISEHSP